MIDATSDADLKHKDALGRTILHWLVVYRDEQHRQALIDLALRRGLSMDDKDADGLSPRDWQTNAQKVTK